MKRLLPLILVVLLCLSGCAQKLDGDGMVGKAGYIQIDQWPRAGMPGGLELIIAGPSMKNTAI